MPSLIPACRVYPRNADNRRERQTSESKIEPVPKVRLACHHNFRERSVDMELANPRVSPLNYTKERDRVDAEAGRVECVMGRGGTGT